MSSAIGPRIDMPEEDVESFTSVKDGQSSTVSMYNGTTELVQTFTCFPKLPAEIRLKIWKEALPGPRVMRIQLKLSPKPPRKEGQKKRSQVSRFVASCPPPVGLRVCRESRIEGLKEYEIGFPTKTSPAQTYVNYDIDTFVLDTLGGYFPYSSRRNWNGSVSTAKRKKPVILHKEFSKIRSLVIDERFLWSVGRLLTHDSFCCLEMISIIVFDKSNSSLMRGLYDLEERGCPRQPERQGPSLGWINAWLDAMANLAHGADASHVTPLIRFVDLIKGSGSKETISERADSIESDEDDYAEGLFDPNLDIYGAPRS